MPNGTFTSFPAFGGIFPIVFAATIPNVLIFLLKGWKMRNDEPEVPTGPEVATEPEVPRQPEAPDDTEVPREIEENKEPEVTREV